MAWKGIIKVEFPEKAEWFEEFYPDNLDDLEPEPGGAIEFNFRMHQSSKGVQEPIPGLQLKRDKEYKIECKPELDFKPGDQIRFNKNPNATYTITDIEYIIDNRNKYEYLYTATSWPGRIEETKIMLVTLK